jgi:hypothetical protein
MSGQSMAGRLEEQAGPATDGVERLRWRRPCCFDAGRVSGGDSKRMASLDPNLGMTQTVREEQIMFAYVHAVAGRAGVAVRGEYNPDYGLDGSFAEVRQFGSERIDTGPLVNFQMKASVGCRPVNGKISYDCKARAYNRLCLATDAAKLPTPPSNPS